MLDVEILNQKSVRLERSLVFLIHMVENACSQMYVDPNKTSSFMAIFLKLTNLDVLSNV